MEGRASAGWGGGDRAPIGRAPAGRSRVPPSRARCGRAAGTGRATPCAATLCAFSAASHILRGHRANCSRAVRGWLGRAPWGPPGPAACPTLTVCRGSSRLGLPPGRPPGRPRPRAQGTGPRPSLVTPTPPPARRGRRKSLRAACQKNWGTAGCCPSGRGSWRAATLRWPS
ncbi:MAG: hypothetical protein J3K34DRAFT_415737 [Monoraphidium minutum]|nr:MAG: hypothetical protein J3K34DRAFT_415737 [Monoraphidium minutum]